MPKITLPTNCKLPICDRDLENLRASGLPGMMVEPPAAPTPGVAELMRRLDLKTLYDEFRRKVTEVARRPANKRGRPRGPAGTKRREAK